jgi:PhzF family phenazine biosynthesis protein
MASSHSDILVQKFAAFSDGTSGGNPAGIVIGTALPPEPIMRRIAAAVGFSETAFAVAGADAWRVRYFSPESEVPFCGHATIALGAALAMAYGDGVFTLRLNDATITVEGRRDGPLVSAALQSPAPRSRAADAGLVRDALALFGYSSADLDPAIHPALANAGANHLILALNSRVRLGQMRYQLDAGRTLMNGAGLVTIMLLHAETPRLFHVRNPFASGGVYEDPATGAAAAALGGYLREIRWPHGNAIEIVQGEDMGMRSRIRAEIPPLTGASIRVSGTARVLD